jgi:hypothetical protein
MRHSTCWATHNAPGPSADHLLQHTWQQAASHRARQAVLPPPPANVQTTSPAMPTAGGRCAPRKVPDIHPSQAAYPRRPQGCSRHSRHAPAHMHALIRRSRKVAALCTLGSGSEQILNSASKQSVNTSMKSPRRLLACTTKTTGHNLCRRQWEEEVHPQALGLHHHNHWAQP